MYRIKKTPHYYHGTINAPQENYVTREDIDHDDQSDIHLWDTRESAQAWIDEQESNTYYLAHGEAGRPDYTIEDEDEGTGETDCIAHSIAHEDWQAVPAAQLPAGVQDTLEGLQVEYDGPHGDSHETYCADTEIDGIDYRISYCVSTAALQVHNDDLSGIDWDHETYYVSTDDYARFLFRRVISGAVGTSLRCNDGSGIDDFSLFADMVCGMADALATWWSEKYPDTAITEEYAEDFLNEPYSPAPKKDENEDNK